MFGHTFALRAEVHSWLIVTGTQARRPVLRGDLNLQEVGKGRASPASNLLPIKTLAEVDFNSYRPADIVCCGAGSSQKTVTALDLATIGQSSGKPF